MTKPTLKNIKQALFEMARAYAEKRTDVNESIYHILDTGEFDPDVVEHRFSKFVLSDGTIVRYDTCTTMLDIVNEDGDKIGDSLDGYYFD